MTSSLSPGRSRLAAVSLVLALGAGLVTGLTAAHAATPPAVERIAGDDRIATAVAISRATFERASTVVLARADVAADGLAGVPLAAHLDAPLLLVPRDEVPAAVAAEIDRLGAREAVVLGGTGAISSGVGAGLGRDVAVRRLAGDDRIATAIAIARELPAASRAYVASAEGFADALTAGPVAAASGAPLLLVGPDPTPVVAHLAATGVDEVVVAGGTAAVGTDVAAALGDGRSLRRISGPDRYATGAALADAAVAVGAEAATVWLATGADFPDSLAAGPAVAATSAVLLLVDGASPWSTAAAMDRLRAFAPDRVVVVGGAAAITADVDWQLRAGIAGPRLPLGGSTLFPRHRLVAFYGHHRSAALGVLGEQAPDAAYRRLAAQSAGYGADGRTVLPVFELIVDVATASPGPDGDYSAPSTIAQIQPWLDAARRNGAYLLLDLQSGRTDFLTAARRYETLLREPDVGLALDPEWRVGPGQRPAQLVGHVDAAEVNAVSDWLAGLVRDELLPQKLFVVHQFQLQMIRDRDDLVLHPELATVIQMDGQGSRAAKLDTFAAITRSAGPWRHGFKLFYDEDPNMFAPSEVMGLQPRPDLVSYQ